MKAALLFGLLIAFPSMAAADGLTKAEYFRLYTRTVKPSTVAARLETLFDQLTAAQKTQAKAILKDDLLSALQAKLDDHQANADSIEASLVAPLSDTMTDVDATDIGAQ